MKLALRMLFLIWTSVRPEAEVYICVLQGLFLNSRLHSRSWRNCSHVSCLHDWSFNMSCLFASHHSAHSSHNHNHNHTNLVLGRWKSRYPILYASRKRALHMGCRMNWENVGCRFHHHHLRVYEWNRNQMTNFHKFIPIFLSSFLSVPLFSRPRSTRKEKPVLSKTNKKSLNTYIPISR